MIITSLKLNLIASAGMDFMEKSIGLIDNSIFFLKRGTDIFIECCFQKTILSAHNYKCMGAWGGQFLNWKGMKGIYETFVRVDEKYPQRMRKKYYYKTV